MPPTPPPGPKPPWYRNHPHVSCELCKLRPDDQVNVVSILGTHYGGALVELNTVGITVDLDGTFAYFPWLTVQAVLWNPVRQPDDADHH